MNILYILIVLKLEFFMCLKNCHTMFELFLPIFQKQEKSSYTDKSFSNSYMSLLLIPQ